MNTGKIIKELEKEFPPQLAMDWDNSGLQVGSRKNSVKKVVVAVDATNAVIESCVAWKAELLITHHPLMLDGIRKVNDESMYGRKILALAGNGITHYAMHTNYDVAKMAELANRALKLKKCVPLEVTGCAEDGTEYGIGSIGELPRRMTAADCCEYVKNAFALDHVRLFGSREAKGKRVAVCPGAGKSMLADALAKEADIFITGDFDHHSGLDAVDQGLTIIDAGHYGVEKLFIAQVADLLKERFPEVKVKTIYGEPFETM